MQLHQQALTGNPLWERILSNTISNNQCLEWQGCKRNGYGRIRVGSHTKTVHRLVAEMMVGKLNRDEFVCHTCDNPSCCNPDHLFIGSQFDNMKDMVAKDRHKNANSGKAMCKRGHVFDEANTYIRKDNGRRLCRACDRERKAGRI
jgi:hypothetical protein